MGDKNGVTNSRDGVGWFDQRWYKELFELVKMELVQAESERR